MSTTPDKPASWDAVIDAVTKLAGLIGGIAALVYVSGGASLWIRLRSLNLQGNVVVSELPRSLLVSYGIGEVALPMAAILVLVLVVSRVFDRVRPAWPIIAISFALIALSVGRAHLQWTTAVKVALVVLVAGVFVICLDVFNAYRVNAAKQSPEPVEVGKQSSERHTALAAALVVLLPSIVCAFQSGTQLPIVSLCNNRPLSGDVRGWLIASTPDHVYIGDPLFGDESTKEHGSDGSIVSVPRARSAILYIKRHPRPCAQMVLSAPESAR